MPRRGGAREASPARATSVWRIPALLTLLLVVLAFGPASSRVRSLEKSVARAARRLRGRPRPDVAWATAAPEDEGLDRAVLDSLRAFLAAGGTEAFLVVRGNHVAYEWYPQWSGPNTRHGLAAMAKATTGELALLTEVSDGRVAYGDPAAKYIPAWRNDSLRSRIRLEDLAAHQSGLATEDFATPHGGWQQPYFEHPEWRFGIALREVPVVYPPGTRYNYAGAGYYVLAYALTAALRNAPYHDIPTLLRDRIMRPMGVPDTDWALSYGQSYPMDGMMLYAMGSGASYTARAAARVGQLILDHGRWGHRQLLDSALVAWSLRPATVPLPADEGGYRRPPSTQGGGWSVNARASWPEVPRDAIAGMGTGHEIILVVPSLDLVMVRMGKALSSDADFGPVLRDRLFAPLMRAVVGPSSRARRSGAWTTVAASGPPGG